MQTIVSSPNLQHILYSLFLLLCLSNWRTLELPLPVYDSELHWGGMLKACFKEINAIIEGLNFVLGVHTASPQETHYKLFRQHLL